jgi:hypothetical protein
MSGAWFDSADAPWGSEMIGAMTGGVRRKRDGSYKAEDFTSSLGLDHDDNNRAKALYQLTKSLERTGSSYRSGIGGGTEDYAAFGILHEAVKSQAARKRPGASNENGVQYLYGPWLWAAENAENAISNVPSNLNIDVGAVHEQTGASNALLLAWQDAASEWGVDLSMSDFLALSTEEGSPYAAIAAIVGAIDDFTWSDIAPDIIMQATVDEEGEIEPVEIVFAFDNLVNDIISQESHGQFSAAAVDAGNISDSVSVITAETENALDAMDTKINTLLGELGITGWDPALALSVDTITSTATAPDEVIEVGAEPVTADADISAAVTAYEARRDTRYNADEANLKAMAFGSRQMLSSFYDKAQALLDAARDSDIAEYDARLGVEQVQQNTQAAIQHRQQLLEQSSQNIQANAEYQRHRLEEARQNLQAELQHRRNLLSEAEIKLRVKLSETESAFQKLQVNRELSALQLELARAQNELDLRAAEAEVQRQMGIISARTEWNRARNAAQMAVAELKLRTQEMNFRGRMADSEAAMAKHSAIMDRIKTLLNSRASWLSSRSNVPGGIAQMLAEGSRLQVADRDAWMRWTLAKPEMVTGLAGLYEGIAQMKWKSMLQNTMVLKEGVSAFSGLGGVEHHESGFGKVAQTASLGVGMVAQIAQVASLL